MYTPLEDRSEQSSQAAGDDEQLLSKESQDFDLPYIQKTRRNWTSIILPVFLTIIISVSTFFLGAYLGSQKPANLNDRCTARSQRYSPILKEVDNTIHTVQFNGSFLKENVFRQSVGPESDAAWESLGVNYRSVALPASEALQSGFKPDQVKINEKYGGGFPANVEGLHHLHCLNLLRQSLYFNYDHYVAEGKGAFTNEPNIVRFHVTHCLDILRQQLMCQPDTGLLGQVWWDPTAPKPFVDFNTEHKCKNYDAIREWAKERQLPPQVASDYLQPPKKGDTIYAEIP